MEYLKTDDLMVNDIAKAIIEACKENKIEIVEARDMGVDGGRVGEDGDHQLNIFHTLGSKEYSFNFGPSSGQNNKLTRENAILELAAALVGISRNFNLQFVSLVVPTKVVEKAEQFKMFQNIFIRYIIDYVPMDDSLAERWDILVKKVKNNA